jgi:hypothetical protein
MLIESLKPNVSRKQAAQTLGTPLRAWRRGPLRAVLDFYIPFHLFRVEIISGRRPMTIHLAMDAVTGSLDPYRFDDAPGEEQITRIDTQRAATANLDIETLRTRLGERIMRMVFLGGFFKIKRYGFTADPVADIHMPYWIGVYERGGAVELEVIDAVRDRLEGAKVREIAAAWFRINKNDRTRGIDSEV